MATYYVSSTTGNDSNAGTSVGAAKATLGAGENLATTAGDIVYIAPGTYREKVVHGYSGTAADRIYFIGDPDCEIFTAITPGIIRVTISDANDIAENGGTQYIIKSNGKDYITWKNVYVDGGSGGVAAHNDNNNTYGFYANTELDNMEIINCMGQHLAYACYRVAYVYDSVMMGYAYGISAGYIADRCIGIAPYIGISSVNLARNCVASGYYGFMNCDKVVNCTSFGGSTGLRTGSDDFIYDSVAVNGYYAFMGGTSTSATSNGTISGSLVVMSRYATYYGKQHGIKIASTYNQWLSNRDPVIGAGGTLDMQGDGTYWPMAPQPLYSINNVRKLADVVTPTLSSVALRGSTTTETDDEAGATDFYGNPRKMGATLGIYNEGGITSSRDLGHVELSVLEVTGSVSSSQPGFSILDEGIFRIPIAVSASSTVTASIGLRHNAGGGTAVKPKFELRYSQNNATASATSTYTTTVGEQHLSGSNLTIQSNTSTAADNVFETLSVSGSFTKQTELELVFINQQTGSDSISTFSDLEIT